MLGEESRQSKKDHVVEASRCIMAECTMCIGFLLCFAKMIGEIKIFEEVAAKE